MYSQHIVLLLAKIVKKKMLGSWTKIGTCLAHGCNQGVQLQHRDCKDGSKDICYKKEQTRKVRCKMSNAIWKWRNCTENWDC